MKRLLAFAFSSEASLRWGIDQVEKRFGKIPFVTDGEHKVNESSADHPHEWYCTWDALEQLNQLYANESPHPITVSPHPLDS